MTAIWTSRIGQGGASELNITIGSASRPMGKILAPTKTLVYGHKTYRGDVRFAGYKPLDDAMYREQYLDLIRSRFQRHQSLFRALFERDELTLSCYCRSDQLFCHRHVVAQTILAGCASYFEMAYDYRGEC